MKYFVKWICAIMKDEKKRGKKGKRWEKLELIYMIMPKEY